MDRTQVDELVTKFRSGELSRRGFIRKATALGISAGAAGMLARSAVAQDATPGASPSAGTPSPLVGTPDTPNQGEVASIAPPTREAVTAAIREEFGITDPEVEGGQVIYGQTTDIDTMNLLISSDVYSGQIGGFVYEYLIGTNPIDGTFVPALADTWNVADDGITYTFSLNPNVVWHDGTPFTANDVVFSFDATLDENTLSPRRESVLQFLESYRAVDDQTVEFVATDVWATFLDNTVGLVAIMPQHIWGDVPVADWGADPGSTGQDVARVVGTGPFTFVEWVPEDHVTLEKNPDYWDTTAVPVIDTLTYRVIVEPSALIQALETGELDFSEVDATQAQSLSQNPELNVVNFDTLGVNWFAANQDPARSELFTDVRVRQALMYALDRQLISEQVYQGYAIQADGTQPVLSLAYRPDEINTIYNFDPEMAGQLLDEAGWMMGDDGVRVRDNVRLSFECLFSEGVATYEVQVPYMQQAWGDVGIEMIPTVVPFTALLDGTDTGNYDMAIFGFNWGVDGGQLPMFGCDFLPPQGFNSMRYCNQAVDELWLQADRTLPREGEERISLLVEASNAVNDEAAAGYLVFRQEIAGSRQTLHNFMPNGYSFLWWMTYAWTEVQE